MVDTAAKNNGTKNSIFQLNKFHKMSTVLKSLELIKSVGTVSGEGANGAWKKSTVLFRIPGDYPKDVAVDFWNDKREQLKGFTAGSVVDVHIDIESREHNGRYFTNISSWKIEAAGSGNGSAPATSSAQSTTPPAGDEDDDLPF